MERIRNIIVVLRGQLWIIPLSLLALGLAYWALAFGPSVLEDWDDGEFWCLYGGDASSARGLLSSLFPGVMTMFSLVVPITFVLLMLAANQLGPRLIATFMSDRQIRFVLGLFVSTILYVLVVLRSLDETFGAEGVPHAAVTIGSVLTILCLFALLFYVHKIARGIVADSRLRGLVSEQARSRALSRELKWSSRRPDWRSCSSASGRTFPMVCRLGSEQTESSAGDQMTLKVEAVADC